MQKSTAGGSSFDKTPNRGDPDTGGADDVQKTSYVTGQGTDPDARDAPGPSATVRSGGGINIGVWVILALALVIALVYGFGLFG